MLSGCGSSATLFSVQSNGSITGHGGRCMDALPTLRMAQCGTSSISQKWSTTGGSIRLAMQLEGAGLGARLAPLEPTNLWQVQTHMLPLSLGKTSCLSQQGSAVLSMCKPTVLVSVLAVCFAVRRGIRQATRCEHWLSWQPTSYMYRQLRAGYYSGPQRHRLEPVRQLVPWKRRSVCTGRCTTKQQRLHRLRLD